VLHLYRRFRPDFTGDGIYYEQLIPLMSETGSRHHVLVFETAPPPIQEAEKLRVTYLQAPRGGWLPLLRWIIRHRRDFDLLHIHTHVDRLFTAYWAARLFGWKLVYSSTLADRLDELVATYRPLYRRIARLLFGLVHMFVGISPRLFSGHLLRPGRACLIPQGVQLKPPGDENSRRATRQALGIGEEEIVLLYVGSLCLRKGVHLIADAFIGLAAENPKLKLMLVGPTLEPAYGEAIFQRLEQAGLLHRLIRIDFDPSPDRFYQAADIFLFASSDEGFGNVLLEAMSHGLPVVSSYLDGVTEAFIEHGQNGFLFSRPADMASMTRTLIGDGDLRRRIGTAARRTVFDQFRLEQIATRYRALYEELLRGRTQDEAVTGIGQPSVIRRRDDFPMRPVPPSKSPPVLCAVIDTESEFDWSKGVAADLGAVRSIEKLPAVQEIFERHGMRPCYVIDYPVATGATSRRIMRAMAERGADIGAHLQPWTTPPFIEPVDNRHAFPGNLPVWLQRQKLAHLGEAIESAIGSRPRVFKAGRYGIGRFTLSLLEEMGYDVDLSVAPGFDYRPEHGPDFSAFGSEPAWFGQDRALLEIPTTSAFTGALRAAGPGLWKALAWPGLRHLHLRGILDRGGLFSRLRLSPEGHDLRQMQRLARHLVKSGETCLTLSFHSSSLQPGFTPYCRTAGDVGRMLERVDHFLRFFREELGGRMASPLQIHAELKAASPFKDVQ
jgi:glycosyltransferase involved in cell wall biosynthesis/peptidoglycan/xylan/chitin deacetylase (PgdA/CDA1 family)